MFPHTRSMTPDYYEVLQINRNADAETVQRVYRFMAARFHPDNSKTGDIERFLLLRQAYEVLSAPELRAKYDAKSAAADCGGAGAGCGAAGCPSGDAVW